MPKGQEEEKRGSIYDFIYYDKARISSIISQMDDFGTLKEILYEEKVKEGSRSKSASISANVGPFGGELSGSLGEKISGETTNNRIYDAYWSNALNFLDMASERNIISKNIASAGIGELVIFSGELEIVDLNLIHKMYEVPELAAALEGEQNLTRQQRRYKERKNQESRDSFPIALLKAFPHTIQLRMFGGDGKKVWGNMEGEYLITSTEDLVLKYSWKIPGKWHVVAILDARPDGFIESYEHQMDEISKKIDTQDNPAEATYLMHKAISPMIRAILGRPSEYYGITPLLIFRKIAEVNLD